MQQYEALLGGRQYERLKFTEDLTQEHSTPIGQIMYEISTKSLGTSQYFRGLAIHGKFHICMFHISGFASKLGLLGGMWGNDEYPNLNSSLDPTKLDQWGIGVGGPLPLLLVLLLTVSQPRPQRPMLLPR